MINLPSRHIFRSRVGLSLIEVIIAVALFSLFATALVGLVITNFGSDVQARDKIMATRFAEQGLEAVWSIRRQAWNQLVNGTYGVSSTSGSWQFSPGPDNLDGIFTRAITVADGCRNGAGVFVDCLSVGAIHDLYAKKITSHVTYTAVTGVANEVTLTTYLTNWQSRDWVQTDWSAGAGQTIWSNPSRYDSASGIDTSVAGRVTLALQATNWVQHSQSPIASQNIFSVASVSANDVWAAGASGKIFHFNGSTWSQFVDTGNQVWNALTMSSSTDGWVVGPSGQMYWYNGLTWSLFADVGSQTLFDIAMVSPTDGWIVAGSGKFYRFNGSAWSEFVDLNNETINSITMVSPTNGWAAGASGKIYHYDGSTWSQFVDTGSHRFNDIVMVSPTDGWAVGTTGKIYHYNGTNWSQFIDTGNTEWRAIAMVSPTDGWIVGASGSIRRFNGTSWTTISSPVTQTLNSITMVSASSGWIVGNAGRVLELAGSGYATNGWLVSSAFNTGSTSAFNAISWSQSLAGCIGCSIKLQVRTAPEAGGVPGTWTSWYGATGAGTYFTTPGTQLLPQALNFNQWAQYRVELAGDGNSTPLFYDVTVNYTP